MLHPPDHIAHFVMLITGLNLKLWSVAGIDGNAFRNQNCVPVPERNFDFRFRFRPVPPILRSGSVPFLIFCVPVPFLWVPFHVNP